MWVLSEVRNTWKQKAEVYGFPSVEESASEDVTMKSYGDFEIPQNSKNGLKINSDHQN